MRSGGYWKAGGPRWGSRCYERGDALVIFALIILILSVAAVLAALYWPKGKLLP